MGMISDHLRAQILYGIQAGLLIASNVCLSGCWTPRPSQIPGQYAVSERWGKAHLTLRTDGTFVEEVTRRDGSRTTSEGTWEYGKGLVSRKPNCLLLAHDAGYELFGKPVGACGSGVDVSIGGSVELSIDPDFGLAYQKVGGPADNSR